MTPGQDVATGFPGSARRSRRHGDGRVAGRRADYDDDLVLRGELATGGSGLDVHYATGTFPAAERVSMLGR